MPVPLNKRTIAIAGALAVIIFVVGLRLSWRPAAPPPPPPPTGNERYFTWTVVLPNLDPIIVERESKLFAAAAEAVRKDPDFADGWMTMAGSKKSVGDFEGAAAIWEHVNEIRPFNSPAYNNLGDLYANFVHDYPKAEAAFRQAIKNSAGEEKNAYYYQSLFDIYRYRFEDPAKALATLDEGLKANPASGQLAVKAARYAAEINERPKALAFYRSAIKLLPTDAQLKAEYEKYRDGR